MYDTRIVGQGIGATPSPAKRPSTAPERRDDSRNMHIADMPSDARVAAHRTSRSDRPTSPSNNAQTRGVALPLALPRPVSASVSTITPPPHSLGHTQSPSPVQVISPRLLPREVAPHAPLIEDEADHFTFSPMIFFPPTDER